MSTSSIADAQWLLPLEKHAERWVLTVPRGAAFTNCLKIIGLAPALKILTAEGKTSTMRGSDIYDSRTWKKVLSSINQQEHRYQRTERGEHLAGQDKAGLLHERTTRYRALSAEADLTWFERVIILAVTRHSMEQQYDASTTQGLETIGDPRVAREMGNRLMLNPVVKESARRVHHIVREPTRARQLIAQCYEEHDRQMQARSLVTREALPALAPGATSPCALWLRKRKYGMQEEPADEQHDHPIHSCGSVPFQKYFCFKDSAPYDTIHVSARLIAGHMIQKECPYGKTRTWRGLHLLS